MCVVLSFNFSFLCRHLLLWSVRARSHDEQTCVQSLHALREKLVSCSHDPLSPPWSWAHVQNTRTWSRFFRGKLQQNTCFWFSWSAQIVSFEKWRNGGYGCCVSSVGSTQELSTQVLCSDWTEFSNKTDWLCMHWNQAHHEWHGTMK